MELFMRMNYNEAEAVSDDGMVKLSYDGTGSAILYMDGPYKVAPALLAALELRAALEQARAAVAKVQS